MKFEGYVIFDINLEFISSFDYFFVFKYLLYFYSFVIFQKR